MRLKLNSANQSHVGKGFFPHNKLIPQKSNHSLAAITDGQTNRVYYNIPAPVCEVQIKLFQNCHKQSCSTFISAVDKKE